jgi:hypothetical protein
MNPELDELVQARGQAATATNPQGSTARAAAAAGSLKPASAVPTGRGDASNLKSVLDEEWDRATRRATR